MCWTWDQTMYQPKNTYFFSHWHNYALSFWWRLAYEMSQIFYFRVDLCTAEILFVEDVVWKWDYKRSCLSLNSLFYIFSFILDLRWVPYDVSFSNTMVLINWIKQSRKHANEASCLPCAGQSHRHIWPHVCFSIHTTSSSNPRDYQAHHL